MRSTLPMIACMVLAAALWAGAADDSPGQNGPPVEMTSELFTSTDADALFSPLMPGASTVAGTLIPPNDFCADASSVLDGGIFTFDSTGATDDGPAESGCSFDDDQVHQDVWFDYLASCTGTATVETCGSSFDTRLVVYSGCGCPPAPGSRLECNDDSCGSQSSVGFSVTAGQCYKIRVGGPAPGGPPSSGLGQLSIGVACDCTTAGDCDDGLGCTLDSCEPAGCDNFDPNGASCEPDLHCAGYSDCDVSGGLCACHEGWIADQLEPGTVHAPPAAPDGCAPASAAALGDTGTHEVGHWLGLYHTHATQSVYLHSGEFYHTAVDLVIPGRGIDLVWGRKYRSKVGPNTVMGNGWDFSYNIRVEAFGDDLMLHDGNSRRDVYTLQSNGTWIHDEFFRVISSDLGGFSVQFTDQSVWRLHPLDGSPQQGKLSEISDRFGNTMTYEYDSIGRLTRIHDTLDTATHTRDVVIGYNTDGLIQSVMDWTGRQVRYAYYQDSDTGGSAGDLKSVTTPPVTGTPNGNDYPTGKTTVYTYSKGHADDRLNHNLLTITDPKGQTYLSNTYAATTNPLDLNFDRLVRQSIGDPSDVVDLVYAPQTPGPGMPAVVKATMNDRMGNVSEHFYDAGNRCVMVREYTGRADPGLPTNLDTSTNPPVSPLRATDPAFYETRYEWNANSLPTRLVLPEVDDEVLIYDSANPDHRKSADLRERCHNPGPRGGDQSMICELFEYDTNFGGCCGSNFVVRHTDPRGNDTQYSYDAVGNLTHAQHPITSVVEDWAYNSFGQLTAYVHPDNGSGHRRRDELHYYQPIDGCMSGYLKDIDIDAPGLGLTTTYEYDCLGRMTRTIDPRGNDSLYDYNQLDQVVRTQSEEVPAAGGGTVRYERLLYYDPNDNPVRVCVDNKDELGVLDPGNAYLTTLYEYDILNYVTRTCSEHGSYDVPQSPPKLDCTGLPDSEFLRTEYEYDSNNNLTLTRFGEAANGNQPDNVIHDLYDERDLLFSRVYGPGDAHFGSITLRYNRNGAATRLDLGLPATPRTWTYAYDGFNRLTLKGDSFGNDGTYHYDPNGNMLTLRIDGELLDGPTDAGNVRLFETTYAYDSMNRLTRETTAHFDDTQAPILDGQSTTQAEYSDSSHLLRTTDDRGNALQFSYDTANRLTLDSDPLGNTTTYEYDSMSVLTRITSTELSDLGSTPQQFQTTYSYDALNRLTSQTDSAGNAFGFAYDSRGNLRGETDPLTLETRYEYDSINRLTRSIRDMDGDGASATDPDDIVLSGTWDDSLRLRSRTDDNGNTTSYEYDELGRLTHITSPDATEHTYEYDNYLTLTRTVDPNGTDVSYAYDSTNRLTLKGISFGAGVAPDTTFERFAYDGLSRVVRAEDDDSVVTRTHDSLSNRIRETINGVTTGASHDGVGNQTQLDYPTGGSVEYTYDALNRITLIGENFGGPITDARYHYFGRGRVERIDLGNGTQSSFEYDGIVGIPNPPGDFGAGQIIRSRHEVPATAVLDERTYLWDPLYNKLRRSDVRPASPQLTHEYAYDPMFRLTRTVVSDSAGPVDTVQYDLDGVGNRLAVTGGPNPGTYLLDPTLPEPADFQMNQYTATPGGTRSYDANGNLTGKDSAVCGVVPPEPCGPDPSGLSKNRAISFASPSAGGEGDTAIRVRLKRLYITTDEDPDNGCPVRPTQPDLSQFEEEIRWLGPPAEFPNDTLPASPNFVASKLECCPLFRAWTVDALSDEFGPDADPSLLFGYGEEVFPCSIYEVQQVSIDCPDLSDESCYSPILEVRTSEWGDIIPPYGTVSFQDINAAVNCYKFISLSGGQNKGRCKLHGNSPNFLDSVSFMDIGLVVNAYKTIPYAEDGPLPGLCSGGCGGAGGAGDCISYDYRNQMVEFNDQDTGSVHRYQYDAFGRRIAKIVDAFGSPQETRYYYDGGQVIEEQDGSGATQALAIKGMGCGGHIVWISAGQRYYCHGDDLGNPVAMTDVTGGVVERYEYGDYGAPTVTDGAGTPLPQSAIGNPYLFGGRRYDAETGWYLHGSRYLDPKAGRYVTRRNSFSLGIDIGPHDGTTFTFAGDNPWTYVDLDGRARKPREIVVVGSKVKEVVREAAMFLPDGVPIRAKSSVSLAAIAIPNLLDARKSGNESAAPSYCAQYRETDFNFVSRLMEEEGIYYSMPLLPPLLDDRRWRALQTRRVAVRGWDPVQNQVMVGSIQRVRGGCAAAVKGQVFPKVEISLSATGGGQAAAVGALKTLGSAQTLFQGMGHSMLIGDLSRPGGGQAAGALKTLSSAQTLYREGDSQAAAIGALKTLGSAQTMFRGDVTLKRGVFRIGDVTLKRGVFGHGDVTLKRGILAAGAQSAGGETVKRVTIKLY